MTANLLKYLFSTLSAIYFIFAGTGYNIVQYCCNDCANEGIDFVVHHSCAAVHEELHHDCCDMENSMSAEDHHQTNINIINHDQGCHITRIQLDDFSVGDKITLAHILSFDNIFVNNTEKPFTEQKFISHVLHSFYSPPDIPVLCGREILTNKSVLVI